MHLWGDNLRRIICNILSALSINFHNVKIVFVRIIKHIRLVSNQVIKAISLVVSNGLAKNNRRLVQLTVVTKQHIFLTSVIKKIMLAS